MEDGTASGPGRSAVGATGWEINWLGLLGVVGVVIAVLLGRSFVGDSPPADDRTDAVVQTTLPTIAARVTTTTRAATTTVAPTTTTVTTTTVPERRVVITGEVKPCRFGDRCLTASFVIEGFDSHPGSFTCVYPNSTSDFGFNDNEVVDACLTGDIGDTITIEVDGVRSATISETDLDGAG